MAQGSVSGILDYTAGGNVFGILGGGVRTESGHEEWNGYIPGVGEGVVWEVVFEKKFRNPPEVIITNETCEAGDEYCEGAGDITNAGFNYYVENPYGSRTIRTSGSFDWTATGK